MTSLLKGLRPDHLFSEARVPVDVAPETRERLRDLLNSQAFAGRKVGFTAFIDRACEAAETEYAEALPKEQWCPVCHGHHDHPGEKQDDGKLVRQCPMIPQDDPRNVFANFPGRGARSDPYDLNLATSSRARKD